MLLIKLATRRNSLVATKLMSVWSPHWLFVSLCVHLTTHTQTDRQPDRQTRTMANQTKTLINTKPSTKAAYGFGKEVTGRSATR